MKDTVVAGIKWSASDPDILGDIKRAKELIHEQAGRKTPKCPHFYGTIEFNGKLFCRICGGLIDS